MATTMDLDEKYVGCACQIKNRSFEVYRKLQGVPKDKGTFRCQLVGIQTCPCQTETHAAQEIVASFVGCNPGLEQQQLLQSRLVRSTNLAICKKKK